MQSLWFILAGCILGVYVVLDGFDLGAGMIHLFVARSDGERRAILRAIGPVWDGNEVWLVATGATLFLAFPVLFTSSFSGFYLPLIIVLWLLMLRGIAIELRSQVPSPVWAAFWDGTFFLGSALLALFYGAALANVVRGVPLDRTGSFFEPLWTDFFKPGGATPGILDWYTVLIGMLALAVLTAHGANWIALKTEGQVRARARRICSRVWLATLMLTALGTWATFSLRPALLQHFGDRHWGIVFPALALAGLAGIGYHGHAQRDLAAFLSSTAYLAGMLAATAFALYPAVLPAVVPAYSLTIHNASASSYGLSVGLVWWCMAIVLIATYFILIYWLFRGKVAACRERQAG